MDDDRFRFTPSYGLALPAQPLHGRGNRAHLSVPTTSSMSPAKSTDSGLSSSLPASIFERSRTSLMRLSRWVPAALTRRSGSSATIFRFSIGIDRLARAADIAEGQPAQKARRLWGAA